MSGTLSGPQELECDFAVKRRQVDSGVSCTRKQVYFQHGRKDISKSGRHVRAKCRPLRECIRSQAGEHQQFLDLLEKMLEYEPSQRISLSRALRHPFLAPAQQPPRSVVGSESPDLR
ncbi:dual specificity protein kinase CLK2-like [Entelurus aequoreus]|uniref:dual specificity protein kinase CLK2-like n=1 Tax=Entelurus aequoreus TaxID=161455 RepID=UPI002B1DF831|nr:dual specificity protein kinase CLK2-like [Entelurus aequoreus]